MPRDLPIGNGNLLISFDADYYLREFFFPHVGEESHTGGGKFRFGVWVDGQFSWIADGWQKRKGYADDSLVTDVELFKEEWQLKITSHDFVDFYENLYGRKLVVENLSSKERDVRLFFASNFQIYGNEVGDTAEFRPCYPDGKGVVLHYKAERYFLSNIYANGAIGVSHFATGNKGVGAFEGTWRDAEDGVLSQNPIAQGSVDSVVAIDLKIAPNSKESCFYWIACGTNWSEVHYIDGLVAGRGLDGFLERTLDYWKLWVNKEGLQADHLPPKLFSFYKRSLLIARTQINNCGSIIAANDSDALAFNRDTYSYMWPRDGALVAHSLDLAGYQLTESFYTLCANIIEKEGYFLHKYTPAGSLASSWHPWVKEQKPQLPIQEDETALVIWALWHHFVLFKDVEFIGSLYKRLVKRAADFMVRYRDPKTGLPLLSYDLWEERQGVLTFTVSAVYGGLMAASRFAEAFGEENYSQTYKNAAAEIRAAMDKYLYLEKEKRFARMIEFKEDRSYTVDATIDASLYGLFAFDAYPASDPRVVSTMEQVRNSLWNHSGEGGLARYENDSYYREDPKGDSNPWFVTTLWLAQYEIGRATNQQELEKAVPLLEWVCNHALPSGVLAEQIHPKTGRPLSVSPLTWSHAAYITTVQHYLRKQATF